MSNLIQIHEPGETPLPHADVTAIGIDLGTTHSVVAVSTGHQAEAIHDAHGRAIIPSVVQFDGQHAVVGTEARKAALEGEGGVLSSIKRLMGKSATDLEGETLPYSIDNTVQGMVRIKLGERRITPVEVSAEILRHLKRMAVEALGRDVTRAVITVPAYFDDAARAATKDAAKLAGLDVLRLINEPTAAALAYGLDKETEGVFAIYDMGGGTFDISILKLVSSRHPVASGASAQDLDSAQSLRDSQNDDEGEKTFQVLATAGDTALGGDDMDRAIADLVQKYAKKKSPLTPAEYGQLLGLCRLTKEQLTTEKSATITWGNADVTITHAQLDALVEPLVTRSILCCERALADARLTPQAIQGVILVGGATRMGCVRKKVADFFGKPPLDTIDPDLTVALGAAIQAEALTIGSDHLLLDVTPLSLGLETMGGIVEKIIYRNTPIPAAFSQEFTTYKDGQGAMKIHVVQGEREKVGDCRSLAQFELRGIPPLPAGVARIEVTFSIDADGLLTVKARELITGTTQEVAVKPAYGLEFEEIERMLATSMEHARTDIMERLTIEARVEAERAASEVESAMVADAALLKQGEAEMLGAQLARLRKAAEGVDRERMDYERTQLNMLAGPFAERRMNQAIAGALSGKRVEDVK